MFGQECGQSLPVVRPVLLGLAQSVYQDDGDVGGDLPLLVQQPQGLQDAGRESLAGVDVTVVDGEQSQEVGPGLDQVVVGGQLGRLAQLARQGLHELRHQAGGRVVRLTEVVRHGAGGDQGAARGGRQEEAGGGSACNSGDGQTESTEH